MLLYIVLVIDIVI